MNVLSTESWFGGAVGAALGALGTIAAGFFQNRSTQKSDLQKSVDVRIDVLLKGYEARITDLTGEISTQRNEIVELVHEVQTLRERVAALLAQLTKYETRAKLLAGLDEDPHPPEQSLSPA